MESLDKPLFDPVKAKRGRLIATICVVVILGVTLVQTVPNIISGSGSLAGHLARIGLVVVFGMGAIKGMSLAIFVLSAYTSMAGTYLCILSVYDRENVNSLSMTLGAIYFVGAIVLSLSSAVSENNKQYKFRNVEL